MLKKMNLKECRKLETDKQKTKSNINNKKFRIKFSHINNYIKCNSLNILF